MKKVERSEIVDYVTYEEGRDRVRDAAMRAKGERRVHVGPHLTFLFENHETIHYQVQEMTRAERMVKEADIAHEIESYNELLGGPGELGCTLLVELDDPAARGVKLTKWLALPKHLYIGNVKDKNVLIIDDLRDTANTFIAAVDALKKAGARDIYGAATHPILSGLAMERLERSSLKKLIVSNTIPLNNALEKIDVLDVSKLLANAILRTNQNQSVSSLFKIE